MELAALLDELVPFGDEKNYMARLTGEEALGFAPFHFVSVNNMRSYQE